MCQVCVFGSHSHVGKPIRTQKQSASNLLADAGWEIRSFCAKRTRENHGGALTIAITSRFMLAAFLQLLAAIAGIYGRELTAKFAVYGRAGPISTLVDWPELHSSTRTCFRVKLTPEHVRDPLRALGWSRP